MTGSPLSVSRLVAEQLGRPSGLLGRAVLPRLLNVRNRALNDLTLRCLDLHPADRLLEVGCGGGYLLRRASTVVTEGAVAGVDHSPAMVAYCRRRGAPPAWVGCAGAEALPFPAGCFSRACSVNTLFYLADAPRALAELWRVLAEGGRLVLCFTVKESLQGRRFAGHGLTLYTVAQVQDLLQSSSFGGVTVVRGADRHRRFACAVGSKQT